MDISININIENLDDLIEAIRLISQPVTVELDYDFGGSESEEEGAVGTADLLEHPVRGQVIREGTSVYYVTGRHGDMVEYRMIYVDGYLSSHCEFEVEKWMNANTELLYDPRIHDSLMDSNIRFELSEKQYDKVFDLKWHPGEVEELS